MKLTRREEIAIAVLTACAMAGSNRIRTEDAAIFAGATQMQTAQVVHRLMRAQLIETVRGKHGGIRLKRTAAEITLGDVLAQIGRRAAPTTNGHHPLDTIAHLAETQAIEAFASFTIADLAAGNVDEKVACFQCTIRLGARRPMPEPAGNAARTSGPHVRV